MKTPTETNPTPLTCPEALRPADSGVVITAGQRSARVCVGPPDLAAPARSPANTLIRVTGSFEDLLAANARYADDFTLADFDGVAHAGVAVVTCMDSRIDPLGMLGLRPGDAKILRNPGGRVSDPVLPALVLGVNLLGVDRVLIVPHTRCAMASATETVLRERVGRASDQDASWETFGAVEDQEATLRSDVARVRAHPLVPASVQVGGFLYDVDTGRLSHLV